jgi:hypothetical protein
LQDDDTYTLEISGFCGRIVRELVVEVHHQVNLSVREDQVQVGHTVDLDVHISCPAPVGGVIVNLTKFIIDGRNVIEVPETVEIPEGENTATVTVTTLELAGTASIGGDAADHQGGRVWFLVYDVPVIGGPDSVRQVPECSPFELDIEGTSFDLEPSANRVDLRDGGLKRLEVTGINFRAPHELFNGVLHVESDNLPCGDYQLYVTSHGLESDPIRLEVIPDSGNCRAEIIRFEASPDSITVTPDGTRVTLEFEVFKARYVRIISNVSGEVFSRNCQIFSNRMGCGNGDEIDSFLDSFQIELNESHTFTLEVKAMETGPVTTSTVRVRASEPEITGLRRIWVQNCRVNHHPITVIVEDLDEGTTEEHELANGYDDWGSCVGEIIWIELTDSHRYHITAWDNLDLAGFTDVLGDSDGGINGWLVT